MFLWRALNAKFDKVCENPNFGKKHPLNSSHQHINLADYYFNFLKNLNSESKLDLISKLSQSLKQNVKVDEISLQSLFGAYKSEETADEIISAIRASRVSNRNIETL